MPDIKTAGTTPKRMEYSQLSSKEKNDNCLYNVMLWLGGPFTSVGNMSSVEKMSKWMIKKPDVVHKMMRIAIDYYIELSKYWKETFGVERTLPFYGEPTAANQVISPKQFEEFELPYGITTDNDGNIYFSLVSFDGGKGIKKMTPEGILEDFVAKAGESHYLDLKFGADSRVYGARSPLVRAIFAGSEGGSPAAIPVPDNSARLVSLDFDNNLIYTYGLMNDCLYGEIYYYNDTHTTSFDYFQQNISFGDNLLNHYFYKKDQNTLLTIVENNFYDISSHTSWLNITYIPIFNKVLSEWFPIC